MQYEDMNWEQRQRFQARAASLNKLAALFGLAFQLPFIGGDAMVYVLQAKCVVPTNYQGEA